jgi:hypothetical protein
MTQMTLRQIKMDLDGLYIKTYKTEENLMKRIEADRDMYPEYNDRFMVVRTPNGRWTAIVQLDKSTGGYVGRYDGFMTI